MAGQPIEKRVLECLAENYGIHGALERLGGENLNYMFRSEQGVRHVVKIVDDDMPAAVVEMESQALEHAISAGFQAQLPLTIENVYGNIETGIYMHKKKYNRLRLMKYINGDVLDDLIDISDSLLKNLGVALAEFHLAMQNFDHPAARRSHRWNLAEAGQHEPLVSLLDDPDKRALLAWAFDYWKQAAGLLDSLPWQFIHGDMNRENILVDGDRIVGLVDFGDSGLNPTVCDLAICLAYLMMGREDPLGTAGVITNAYGGIRALCQTEKSLLLPLVCGRLAASVAVSTERRRIDPGHPNWFGSEASAWKLLQFLRERAQSSSFGVL